jgi:hypothetical protein
MPGLDELREKAFTLTTEHLLEEFAASFKITIEQVQWLGVILVEVESRGATATGIPKSFLKVLRRVGKGELLAEAVVKSFGNPRTLLKVAKSSMQEQHQYLATGLCPKPKRKPIKTHDTGVGQRNLLTETSMNATPRDLAGMLVEMILKHRTPDIVWGLVQEDMRLKRLSSKTAKVIGLIA